MSIIKDENLYIILITLMSNVTIKTLTSDNLCCINTILIVFYMKEREGKLGSFLHNLKRENYSYSGNNDNIRSYRELLCFWYNYYRNKAVLTDLLQHEFGIGFKGLLKLVDCLCADDGSDTSLLESPFRTPSLFDPIITPKSYFINTIF